MADIVKGKLVQHATLGLGKVVALEAHAVHVFFADGDPRFAAKLRLPAARAFLRTEGVARDAWLEGLPAFVLDPQAGRYALTGGGMTHEQALHAFGTAHPGGFSGPALGAEGTRLACWREAQARWSEVFAPEKAADLAERGPREVVKRLLAVEKAFAPLDAAADAGAVREALEELEAAAPFCAALLALVTAPTARRVRFEKLFAAARELPVDAERQWLVATVFPFVAAPGRHAIVRPGLTFAAARRLGHDLGEAGGPGWTVYAAHLKLATRLRGELEPLGAKDFADVEVFQHFTATARRGGAARGE
jgi:hypothetical protein